MQIVGSKGVADRVVDRFVNFGLDHLARIWRNDGFLAERLARPPAPGADPVILVNGIGVNNEVLAPAVRSFRRDGITVFAPELPNNALDHIEDTARFLADYVQQVLRETGAKRVDLVGFSEGGLISRAYVKHFGGVDFVDAVISVATPHNGVLHSALGDAINGVKILKQLVPEAAQEMIVGSDFLKRLDTGDPTPDGARWYSISSKGFDGIVWPSDSPVLEGAKNIRLTENDWFPGIDGPHHLGLQRSDEAYRIVRNILLDRL